ncbi:MAG: hypothetical protein MHM6MM_001203 [Cercozoa sp. M6MM]
MDDIDFTLVDANGARRTCSLPGDTPLNAALMSCIDDSELGDFTFEIRVRPRDRGVQQQEPPAKRARASALTWSEIAPAKQAELMSLLFGADAQDEDRRRWLSQKFAFAQYDSSSQDTKGTEFRAGLRQLFGGPCGVLAPLQGELVAQLFFHGEKKGLHCTHVDACAALAHVMLRVLERCKPTEDSDLHICMQSDSQQSLRCLRVTRSNTADVLSCLTDLVAQGSLRVVDLVFSALLTRTAAGVREDMDEPDAMVQRFGHTSQALLNLMLFGRATNNVFDGDKDLGGLKVHGVPHRSDVGLLSVLEALRYSKVGDYLKTPKLPIWVIGSSSHYTVLFGTDTNICLQNPVALAEQRVMRAFTELDPQENGFIPIDQLGNLLLKLNEYERLAEFSSLADPDGLGILLRDHFWMVFRQLNDLLEDDLDLQRPRRFDLYFWNGLGSQLEPKLLRVDVNTEGILSGLGGPGPGNRGSADSLDDVIRTKWPHAVCAYPDGECKIN